FDVGMLDDGYGWARGILGCDRTALCPGSGVLQRLQVSGVSQCCRPRPRHQPCFVHHVEHVCESVVWLTHKIADCPGAAARAECTIAEVQQRVGHSALAHLVVEACGDDVVAFANRAVGVYEVLLVPAGASGSLASTRCTMFSVMS